MPTAAWKRCGGPKHLEQRIERLLTTDHVEKPKLTWEMKIEFGQLDSSGRDVAVMEGLSIGYNGLALLSQINLTLRYGERAALIGPNGSGKTTLLRTLAGLLPPVRGVARLGSHVRAGFMRQEQEDLKPDLNPLTTIQQVRLPKPDRGALLPLAVPVQGRRCVHAGRQAQFWRARAALAGLPGGAGLQPAAAG